MPITNPTSKLRFLALSCLLGGLCLVGGFISTASARVAHIHNGETLPYKSTTIATAGCYTLKLPSAAARVDLTAVGSAGAGTAHTASATNLSNDSLTVLYGPGGTGDEVTGALGGAVAGKQVEACVDTAGTSQNGTENGQQVDLITGAGVFGGGGATGLAWGSNFTHPVLIAGGGGAGGMAVTDASQNGNYDIPTMASCCGGGDAGYPAGSPGVGMPIPDLEGGAAGGTREAAGGSASADTATAGGGGGTQTAGGFGGAYFEQGDFPSAYEPAAQAGCAGLSWTTVAPGFGGINGYAGSGCTGQIKVADSNTGIHDYPYFSGGGGSGLYGGGGGGLSALASPIDDWEIDHAYDIGGGGGGSDFCGTRHLGSGTEPTVTACKYTSGVGELAAAGSGAHAAHLILSVDSAPFIDLDQPYGGTKLYYLTGPRPRGQARGVFYTEDYPGHSGVVKADFTCSNQYPEIATCTATLTPLDGSPAYGTGKISSGQALETIKPGTYRLTVTATTKIDATGKPGPTSSDSVTYQVEDLSSPPIHIPPVQHNPGSGPIR